MPYYVLVGVLTPAQVQGLVISPDGVPRAADHAVGARAFALLGAPFEGILPTIKELLLQTLVRVPVVEDLARRASGQIDLRQQNLLLFSTLRSTTPHLYTQSCSSQPTSSLAFGDIPSSQRPSRHR